MMHAAHPLPEDQLTFGAGFSGVMTLSERAASDDDNGRAGEQAGYASGLSPWVSGRLGLGADWEAGLIYAGRSLRVDGRHAFVFGKPALSVGLGLNALLPTRYEEFDLQVTGAGVDVPVIVGYLSTADVYALWIGARGGANYLTAESAIDENLELAADSEISAVHGHMGGLIGMRVGFRHIYGVFELDGRMHWVDGDAHLRDEVGALVALPGAISIDQFTLSPSAAIVARF